MLLGMYEVKEKIAEGGMGSVYLGHDTNLVLDMKVKFADMPTDKGTIENVEAEMHLDVTLTVKRE